MTSAKNTFHKFLLLWSGSFISAIGSGLTAFGLGVYIFQQDGKIVSQLNLAGLTADNSSEKTEKILAETKRLGI